MQSSKDIMQIISTVCSNNDIDLSTIELTETTDLRDDLQLQSLDLAELTVRIEEAYGVDVFEDGIVSTIGDIMKKLN